MSDSFSRFLPSLDAVTAFHKANFDAAVQAQTALLAGFQTFTQEVVAQVQSHVEAVTAVATQSLGAKTLQEVVERNVNSARTSYDKLVASSTKLSELGVQVANDAFAPIKARATVAAETLLKPLAAA